MCLLAVEVADPQVGRDLLRACYRVAARSGLRSGNREIYVEAVSRWAENAPRHEWSTGELAIHLAIRNRLSGQTEPRGRIPRSLRELLPAPGAGPVH